MHALAGRNDYDLYIEGALGSGVEGKWGGAAGVRGKSGGGGVMVSLLMNTQRRVLCGLVAFRSSGSVQIAVVRARHRDEDCGRCTGSTSCCGA